MTRLVPAFLCLHSLPALAEEQIDFNDQIRPLLSDRCFVCHGFDANAREADLRLDTPEGAFAKNEDGHQAIVPGDLEKSTAWQRIISHDPDDVMPPPDSLRQLSDADKDLIKRWIEQGADYEPHWTFVKVEKPKTELANGHPIDQLVSEKLKQEELEPAPLADPRTLVRRLSFDLRGLPPTPDEVEKFAKNPTDESWATLVEHYLADPAYGERMAWPWLEAARYADTNGFQGDGERTMWPWRDWVIEAFNKNLPYDDFTIWQIAGDLLPNATFEQKLASGFLRNHAINGEGGSIPEENRVNYVFDMAETVGTTWLGLTFNCCRCHDHKYDPLSQKEYYGLNAFFNQTPVNGGGGNAQTPPVLAVASASHKAEEIRLSKLVQDLRSQLPNDKNRANPDQLKWEAEQVAAHRSPWSILPVKSAKAKSQKLTVLPNGTLLASGPNPDKDDYTIELDLKESPLTGFLLKAIRRAGMTKDGIARSDSGNFVLTGFELALRSSDGTTKPIAIKSAQATYAQGGHFKISGVLDKDPNSGWAILGPNNKITKDHAAIFQFTEALQPAPGDTLVATLRNQSHHKNHNLGHFSFEGTTTPNPTLPDDQSLINALRSAPKDRTGDQQQLVNNTYRGGNANFADLKKKEADAAKKLNDFRKRLPKVMIMADQEKKRKTYILSVGAYDQRGEEVEAHTPAFLPPLGKKENANRLDLAQWIVSPKNPLTSRVTVNRLWQEFFGIGLVKSPEDFGVQSEIPVHPRLLDWLAADFMEHNWDYKHLVRTIVTSRTYRQSAHVSSTLLERDPANRLLARGPRFRLPSWMIRDQALAASGLLVPKIGGAPVKPWQPEGLWSEVTFGKKKYAPDSGEKLRRRSLYTFWRRISAPPMFFDSAKREMCEVGTIRTNSPLHALAILNDPLYAETSRALVNRAAQDSTDPKTILARAFEILLSRPPHQDELSILFTNFEQAKKLITEEEAKAFLAIGETPPYPDLPPVTQAALTSVCLSLFNTDESLTKE